MEFPTIPVGPGEFFRFVNHFRGRDFDVGYNVGLLWHPWTQHAFGVTYKSATDMNYEGHATVPVRPHEQHQRHRQIFTFRKPFDFERLFLPSDGKVEYRGRRCLGQIGARFKTVNVNPLAPAGDALPFDWNRQAG